MKFHSKLDGPWSFFTDMFITNAFIPLSLLRYRFGERYFSPTRIIHFFILTCLLFFGHVAIILFYYSASETNKALFGSNHANPDSIFFSIITGTLDVIIFLGFMFVFFLHWRSAYKRTNNKDFCHSYFTGVSRTCFSTQKKWIRRHYTIIEPIISIIAGLFTIWTAPFTGFYLITGGVGIFFLEHYRIWSLRHVYLDMIDKRIVANAMGEMSDNVERDMSGVESERDNRTTEAMNKTTFTDANLNPDLWGSDSPFARFTTDNMDTAAP